MSDYQDIIYSIDRAVATITINRPSRLNAFTGQTISEIENALTVAGNDNSVGVVVITGVGDRAFSSGGDVEWEAEGGLESLEFDIDHMIISCPKPVIARINGYAIGGGHHLAYFCDISIAADHAILGQNGPRVGSPAAGYIVAHAANIVGQKRARELWMMCRRYKAEQALNWGLVNAVVPMEQLDAEVRQWADEMLALSPTCLKILKRSFYYHTAPILQKNMKDIVMEVAPNYFDTGEQMEGATAFLEKRAPDFSQWR